MPEEVEQQFNQVRTGQIGIQPWHPNMIFMLQLAEAQLVAAQAMTRAAMKMNPFWAPFVRS